MIIDYSGWETQDSLFNKHFKENKDYYTCRYGVVEIPVKNIVGLSYNGVLSQNKLDKLFTSISMHGYDESRSNPNDLHIQRYPNGEYCVGTGGNHRTYLVKKLNVESIKAFLEIILIPQQLTQAEIDNVNAIDDFFERSNYLKSVVERLKLV